MADFGGEEKKEGLGVKHIPRSSCSVGGGTSFLMTVHMLYLDPRSLVGRGTSCGATVTVTGDIFVLVFVGFCVEWKVFLRCFGLCGEGLA